MIQTVKLCKMSKFQLTPGHPGSTVTLESQIAPLWGVKLTLGATGLKGNLYVNTLYLLSITIPSAAIGKISRLWPSLMETCRLRNVPRCNRNEFASDTVPFDLISCLA